MLHYSRSVDNKGSLAPEKGELDLLSVKVITYEYDRNDLKTSCSLVCF